MKPESLKKFKQGEAVAITWSDAYSNDGWCDLDDIQHNIDHPALMATLGFWVGSGKRNARVIATISGGEGKGFHVMSIPIGWIIEVRKLK